jgi:hypothetical protein
MRSGRTAIVLGGLLSGLLWPDSAAAQFPGDVFFESPSLAAAQGGTATFHVQAFMGTAIYGAAHMDIVYDPSHLTLVSVDVGESPEIGVVTSVVSSGKVSIVSLNDGSLTAPIGTASLAKVVLRATGSAGTIAPIQIQVRSMLDHASVQTASRGFAGELFIAPAASTLTSLPWSAGAPVASSDSATPGGAVDEAVQAQLQARARALAPEGATVIVVNVGNRPDGSVQLVRSAVRVATQPNTPADVIAPSRR